MWLIGSCQSGGPSTLGGQGREEVASKRAVGAVAPWDHDSQSLSHGARDQKSHAGTCHTINKPPQLRRRFLADSPWTGSSGSFLLEHEWSALPAEHCAQLSYAHWDCELSYSDTCASKSQGMAADTQVSLSVILRSGHVEALCSRFMTWCWRPITGSVLLESTLLDGSKLQAKESLVTRSPAWLHYSHARWSTSQHCIFIDSVYENSSRRLWGRRGRDDPSIYITCIERFWIFDQERLVLVRWLCLCRLYLFGLFYSIVVMTFLRMDVVSRLKFSFFCFSFPVSFTL